MSQVFKTNYKHQHRKWAVTTKTMCHTANRQMACGCECEQACVGVSVAWRVLTACMVRLHSEMETVGTILLSKGLNW